MANIPEYKKREETEFISEGGKKALKILGASLLFALYLFFFIWALLSPFIGDAKIPPDVVRFSFALFFGIALIFVAVIYSGYRAGVCPYCDKKLFFHRKQDGIRCFKCGRYIKIDWEKKVLRDENLDKTIM